MTDASRVTKKKNLIFLFEHYVDIIKDNEDYINSQVRTTSAVEMIRLCNEAVELYDEFYLLDGDNSKVNRWLGYIQGILITINLTTIEDQRNFTRPYLTEHRKFKEYYMSQFNLLSKETITKFALQSGLELKQLDDGTMGLHPYIFTFAENLFKEASSQSDSEVIYYPATLQACTEGNGYVVTFQDIPEAITQGSSFAEAIEYAEDALEVCKDFYIDRPYPKPSSPKRGNVMVGVTFKR